MTTSSHIVKPHGTTAGSERYVAISINIIAFDGDVRILQTQTTAAIASMSALDAQYPWRLGTLPRAAGRRNNQRR